MSKLFEEQPIIIDIGSGMVKAGMADEDAPSHVFSSAVGTPKHAGIMVGMEQQEFYIGDEVHSRRGILKLEYPVQCGVITNWDYFDKVLHHTFHSELRVSPEERPVLLAVSPRTSTTDLEKMAQLLFETYDCPACYFTDQAKLSLSATGRITGTVVDIGDDVSFVVPIYEGVAIPDAATRLDMGGRDLTEFMTALLLDLRVNSSEAIVRDIKEKLCCVALDYAAEEEKKSDAIKETYELPDGNTISIGFQRFRCPEALFRPSLIGKDGKGVHDCIVDSIMKCDSTLRDALYENIVLSGGSSMFEGLAERLQKELKVLAPSGSNVSVIAPSNRKFSAWVGGLKLLSSPAFLSKWVTCEEYKKEGSSILHRKCS